MLNADLASRIEVVRGPQSALWGSEAIGGVIAVNGTRRYARLRRQRRSRLVRLRARQRFGRRSRASGSERIGRGRLSARDWDQQLSAARRRPRRLSESVGPAARDTGVPRRKRRNRSIGPRAWRPNANSTASILFTGAHADTLDNSRNRLAAGRIWADVGSAQSAVARPGRRLRCSARRTGIFLPRPSRTGPAARAGTCRAQVERGFATGAVDASPDPCRRTERETFHARDTAFGGFTDQDRTRDHRVHHRRVAGRRTAAHRRRRRAARLRSIASRMRRASAHRCLAQLGGGFSLAGSYAEGIAQPTFFDLYGFFPGQFRRQSST